ncbi:MlaD family protein [Nocardia bovistercoris]|nr:MlaD family protein [Nocardia bovistercoris]
MLLGAAVVLIAVITLATVTVLYLRPLGQRTITFETTDAAALAPGLEVRVAGITVGKITSVALRAEVVRVQARISAETFVGAESRVEVRMLTPVGGYAVTLVPLGDAALGDAVIPPEHVTVPYSIGDVLQAAPHVTDNVDAATVDADIDQVATALRHNPASVGALIGGMNSIATVMDHQRDQVARIADLASEYLESFNADREFVFDLVRRVDIVVSTYNNTHVGFNEAYRLLGDVLARLQPLERYYLDHKDEVRSAVDRVRGSIEDFQANMGPAIDQLENLRARLARWLTPEGLATLGGGTVSASQICIPLPGRTC